MTPHPSSLHLESSFTSPSCCISSPSSQPQTPIPPSSSSPRTTITQSSSIRCNRFSADCQHLLVTYLSYLETVADSVLKVQGAIRDQATRWRPSRNEEFKAIGRSNHIQLSSAVCRNLEKVSRTSLNAKPGRDLSRYRCRTLRSRIAFTALRLQDALQVRDFGIDNQAIDPTWLNRKTIYMRSIACYVSGHYCPDSARGDIPEYIPRTLLSAPLSTYLHLLNYLTRIWALSLCQCRNHYIRIHSRHVIVLHRTIRICLHFIAIYESV